MSPSGQRESLLLTGRVKMMSPLGAKVGQVCLWLLYKAGGFISSGSLHCDPDASTKHEAGAAHCSGVIKASVCIASAAGCKKLLHTGTVVWEVLRCSTQIALCFGDCFGCRELPYPILGGLHAVTD